MFVKLNSVPIRVITPSVDLEETEHIGQGCFVKVSNENGCFWAEITHVLPDGYSGLIHPELNDRDCHLVHTSLTNDSFHTSEIVDLGCGNFCFC